MTLADSLRDRWTSLSPRERMLIGLGAFVIVVGAGWPLVWQPVTRDLDRNELAIAEARSRLASARQAADEIAGLQRSIRPPATADARAAVERVVAGKGLRGALTAVSADAGRVRLTFASIDMPSLAVLLDALAREEQLFPVEALLAARVEPGTVRAELVLARPGHR